MVEIKNKIISRTVYFDIGQLKQMVIDKTLITIPEFLQRKLLKEKWFAKNYQNCKEFIISVFKQTNVLDTFSVVYLSKLIEVVQDKIDAADGKVRDEYIKIMDLLISFQILGQDVMVCLDGQSRLMLGIMTYIDKNSKYSLDLESNDIELYIDGKRSSILSLKPFNDLPSDIQNYFYGLDLTFNIIEDFAKLEDVIQSLINKQKGFNWSWFQILKQFNRFESYTLKLLEKIKPSFISGYEKSMNGSITDALRFDVDGDQLMLTNLTHLYQFGIWPTEDDIRKTVTNPLHGVTDITLDTIQKYALEYFNFAKAKDADKIKITPLVNYIILRQLIDNVKTQSTIFNNINFNKKYNIIDNTKFIDAFLKWDIILKDVKHDASGIQNPQTKEWEQKIEGYATWSTGQKSKGIERRMKLFVSYFPFDELESNGIITSDIKMPSKEKVLLHNDFKDSNGNSISMREVKKYDRGHKTSKHNKGTNQLDNLVPELLSENRSHQEENIV
jgi:hypothetical protein